MRKMNVFGLTVNVGDRDEVAEHLAAEDEPTKYVVMRVADMPESTMSLSWRKRMLRTPCERCRAICWYDPANMIPGVEVVCLPCVPQGELSSEQSYASAQSLQDVYRELGTMFRRG